jgi:hypothetical protein
MTCRDLHGAGKSKVARTEAIQELRAHSALLWRSSDDSETRYRGVRAHSSDS